MSQPGEKQNRIEIGVVKRRDGYQAIALKKAGDEHDLVWGKNVNSSDMSWDEFCQKICSYVEGKEAGVTLVQESGLVTYLDFEVPAVDDAQLDNIVRMQVESKLVLSNDSFEFAWKKIEQEEGNCRVCVAVVKGSCLSTIATVVDTLKADKVVLDSDAFVSLVCKANKEIEEKGIIVRIYEDHVWLGFVIGGNIVSAVSLDHKLSSELNDPENSLFVQDVINAIDDVKTKYDGFENKVCVAGSDEAVLETVCEVLKSNKIETEIFDPESYKKLNLETASMNTHEAVLMCADCAGGAIAAFDNYENVYDVFRSSYKSKKVIDADFNRSKVVLYGMAVLLVCVIAVLAFYVSDKIVAAKYQKIVDDENVAKAVSAFKLRKEIADERIEAGEILAKITTNLEKGLLLNSISFGRGQRVVLSGTCSDPKKLYSFQEKLTSEKMIKDVRVQSQGLDKKKGKTNFTISFDYKDLKDI